MCTRFRLGAHARHAPLPERSDASGWLCLMRHYGLPTRLLDWTASPLAAAYFAVSHDPKPGPGAIWILDPGELNKASGAAASNVVFLLSAPQVEPLVLPAIGDAPQSDKVIAGIGNEVDFRMVMQQGGFTVHGDATPLENHTFVPGSIRSADMHVSSWRPAAPRPPSQPPMDLADAEDGP